MVTVRVFVLRWTKLGSDTMETLEVSNKIYGATDYWHWNFKRLAWCKEQTEIFEAVSNDKYPCKEIKETVEKLKVNIKIISLSTWQTFHGVK
jgi:hypothetical protein